MPQGRLFGPIAAPHAAPLARARRAAARELARLSHDPIRRGRYLRAALAAVSHDLRTPLATIKASVTALLDPAVVWSPRERTDFLRGIDEETDRLSLMVGNLLDLSRIEGGVLKPDKEWYDVAELVEDVVGRLGRQAGQRGYRLATNVAPDLPLVHCDYVRS
jgi:two-component system sensor histidine kinase KdpD